MKAVTKRRRSGRHDSKHEQGGAAEARSPSRTSRVLCVVLIIGAGLAAYANSFDGAFLFDDDRRIIGNAQIRSLWPPGSLLARRRPLVELSLAVNYALGELRTWGYHAFNLGVHVLAGLTLFGVIRRTLDLGELSRRYGRSSHWLALVVAVLWMVHPLQTQSVTYVIQRSEALMGLFYLASLYCVVRGVYSARPTRWYLASVAACAIGMACKAVMVTAPVVILLYDRAFIAGSFAATFRRRWPLYCGLAGTWGVLFAYGVVQGILVTQPTTAARVGFAISEVTPLDYSLSQLGVVAYYLRLALWPHPLCLDYYWPAAASARDVLVPSVVIAPLLAATLWAYFKKPRAGFVGLWFFLILAPTSSFIPINDLAFEHRMYLPLAAVIGAVVFGVDTLLVYCINGEARHAASRKLVAGVLSVIVALALATATAHRNRDYKSGLAMWQNVIKHRPNNPRAHDNLALEWEKHGRLDLAERELREAITIQPDYVSAYANLGTILFRQGKLDEGIAQYREALRLDPNFKFARIKLGDALVQSGSVEDGIRELRDVVEIAPNHALARYVLGNALAAASAFDEAIAQYQEAIRIAPDYAEAHYSLGNALRDSGRPEAAIVRFREALRMNPAMVSAHNNLGYVLLGLGRINDAADAFRDALALNPDHAGARRGLNEARSRANTAGR